MYIILSLYMITISSLTAYTMVFVKKNNSCLLYSCLNVYQNANVLTELTKNTNSRLSHSPIRVSSCGQFLFLPALISQSSFEDYLYIPLVLIQIFLLPKDCRSSIPVYSTIAMAFSFVEATAAI